jgi:hypothetical protein
MISLPRFWSELSAGYRFLVDLSETGRCWCLALSSSTEIGNSRQQLQSNIAKFAVEIWRYYKLFYSSYRPAVSGHEPILRLLGMVTNENCIE